MRRRRPASRGRSGGAWSRPARSRAPFRAAPRGRGHGRAGRQPLGCVACGPQPRRRQEGRTATATATGSPISPRAREARARSRHNRGDQRAAEHSDSRRASIRAASGRARRRPGPSETSSGSPRDKLDHVAGVAGASASRRAGAANLRLLRWARPIDSCAYLSRTGASARAEARGPRPGRLIGPGVGEHGAESQRDGSGLGLPSAPVAATCPSRVRARSGSPRSRSSRRIRRRPRAQRGGAAKPLLPEHAPVRDRARRPRPASFRRRWRGRRGGVRRRRASRSRARSSARLRLPALSRPGSAAGATGGGAQPVQGVDAVLSGSDQQAPAMTTALLGRSQLVVRVNWSCHSTRPS